MRFGKAATEQLTYFHFLFFPLRGCRPIGTVEGSREKKAPGPSRKPGPGDVDYLRDVGDDQLGTSRGVCVVARVVAHVVVAAIVVVVNGEVDPRLGRAIDVDGR